MTIRKKLEFEFIDNDEQDAIDQQEADQIRCEIWNIIIDHIMSKTTNNDGVGV